MGSFRRYAGLMLLLLPILVVTVVVLASPRQVDAQCGSSASSCKNCHEVQAEYPVNDSGAWHVSHAFGDFCEFCHAGNVQATEMEAAHTSMVYPLEDVNASCLNCHPQDVAQKAEVYAVALGVNLGAGGAGYELESPAGESPPETPDTLEPEVVEEPAGTASQGDVIDFNSRYARTALDERAAVNVGNVILALMSVGLAAFGAVLVWRWEDYGERWRALRAQLDVATSGAGQIALSEAPIFEPTGDLQRVPAPITTQVDGEALFVILQKLDAPTVHALQRVLADVEVGSAMLQALAKLDPRLIRLVAGLDEQQRTLLIAIASEIRERDAE